MYPIDDKRVNTLSHTIRKLVTNLNRERLDLTGHFSLFVLECLYWREYYTIRVFEFVRWRVVNKLLLAVRIFGILDCSFVVLLYDFLIKDLS